jgi:hypothetical protein
MRKTAVDLVATAFSDHHTVKLNVLLSRSTPRKGTWLLENEYISHPRHFLALGFRKTLDDLADAQEVLLKRSVVMVVQVYQTDAEKTFHPDRPDY